MPKAMGTADALDSPEVCFEYNIDNCLLTGEGGINRTLQFDQSNLTRKFEPVLMSCETCLMYMLIDTDHVYQTQNSFFNLDLSTSIKCSKCLENETMLNEIYRLQKTIDEQEIRICRLKEIKDLENDLDNTLQNINDIANGVPILEIDDVETDYRSQVKLENKETNTVIEYPLITKKVVAYKSCQTDIHTNSIDKCIQTQCSAADVNHQSDTKQTTDVSSQTEMSVIHNDTQPENNSGTAERNGQVKLAVTEKSVQTENSFVSEIQTLLIGDETITKLKSHKFVGKVFKIARPGGTLKDLRETTEYFLNKFPNVHTVLFHCGTADLVNGKTEELKREYHLVNILVKSYSATLVISGPIPNPTMSH